MSDLLTNEELVLKEVRIPTGDSVGGCRVVQVVKDIDIDATLKAQSAKTKKGMVERLDNLIWGGVHKGNDQVTITYKFWQALQKEVEDV